MRHDQTFDIEEHLQSSIYIYLVIWLSPRPVFTWKSLTFQNPAWTFFRRVLQVPRRAKSTQRRRPRLLSCFSGRILNIVCVCAAQTQLRCVLSSFASSEQMNSREESLRSTFLITLLFILILHYFTNFGMIPSTSPSQYVFMDQCWFCVCPSKVYVCVCPCVRSTIHG